MKTYYTLGKGSRLDRNKLTTNLEDNGLGKPVSAFWGSPVDAKLGWKEFVQNEGYEVSSYLGTQITWTLQDDAKILTLNSIEDVERAMSKFELVRDNKGWRTLDYNKLKFYGYDAVELTNPMLGELSTCTSPEHFLCVWDCESIVVLNPDKLIDLASAD